VSLTQMSVVCSPFLGSPPFCGFPFEAVISETAGNVTEEVFV
jgi:hypothetical protein